MRVLVLLAALLAFGAILGGCASTAPAKTPVLAKLGEATGLQPGEDEQIAAVLDDVQAGMQTRRIFKVLAHVSRSYHDDEGRDYEAIEAYLNEVFRKYPVIRITRVVPRIIIQADQAQAVETFGTVAEPQDPKIEPPINLQGRVTVHLVKVGGEWQIIEWSRLL
jgi:hypothetical protein